MEAEQGVELPRKLGLLDSTMINVGSMIGSGIFIVPATIALYLQSSVPVVLVWVIGGVVSLFGALSVAELGAMYPKAGGQFVYLREAYSPLWGFLYGWTAFLIINTASIAAVAVTFATYMGYFFPMTDWNIKMLAVASILFLTAINCFGIRTGATIQNIFTISKMAALGALVLMSFILSGGNVSNLSPALPRVPLTTMAGPLLLAMLAVLWSYDGWIEVTYVAGEVKDPDRNLPKSLLFAVLICVVIYVVVNLAMMYVLPLGELSRSQTVAGDVAVKLLGTAGAVFIAGAVIISTFGSNNGFIFTCPRIYYAMAKEGLFFRWLATVNPKYQTPIFSLIAQAVISSVLILAGTYDQFARYVVFASWIFYAMAAAGVMILRRKRPDAPRPYRVWGYPYTPVLFILFALYLVFDTVAEARQDAMVGVLIVAIGVPFFLFWRWKKARVSV